VRILQGSQLAFLSIGVSIGACVGVWLAIKDMKRLLKTLNCEDTQPNPTTQTNPALVPGMRLPSAGYFRPDPAH
jgi:hypothetical protein